MTFKLQARITAFFALIGFYSCCSFLAATLVNRKHAGIDFNVLLEFQDSNTTSKGSSLLGLQSLSSQSQLRNDSAIPYDRQRPGTQQQNGNGTRILIQQKEAVWSNPSSLPPPEITDTSISIAQNSSQPLVSRATPNATASSSASAVAIPPLDTLVNFHKNKIKGDVQFLLDYAVVGFAKCGTTTLSLWLDTHPEISDFPHEVWDLYHGKDAGFIKRMYEKRTKETSGKRRIHGYKCPGDVTRPKPLETLTTHFPKTKLIISIRHPVRFFESFYNYRVSLNHFKRIPGTPNELIGPEKQHDILATAQSAFHVFLASLGKTDMKDEEERQLLTGFYKDEILETKPVKMPHQVFLMETAQLADANETRSEIFRSDLENFLGLEHPLASVPHHRPNVQHEKKKGGKINICDDEHLLARQELLRISRAASQWIRQYFIHSPDVIVSSPSFFEEALNSWMVDPCDGQVVAEA